MGILQDDVAGDIGSVPACRSCRSERVAVDAWAYWNPETGMWELENTFDDAHCHQCENSTKLDWERRDLLVRTRVRELNDRFRTEGRGNGSTVVTQRVQEKGPPFTLQALDQVRTFDAFTKDNDPWGEHDFGAFDLEGEKLFWKLD